MATMNRAATILKIALGILLSAMASATYAVDTWQCKQPNQCRFSRAKTRQRTWRHSWQDARFRILRWTPKESAQANICNNAAGASCSESKKRSCDLCEGFFARPKVNWELNTEAPEGYNTAISADRKATFQKDGTSLLLGNVNITQSNKTLRAEKVQFKLNDQHDKIISARLDQDIVYYDNDGALISAESGQFDFQNRIYDLNNGYYRLPSRFRSGVQDMWGYSTAAHNSEPGILHLQGASYTTCSPINSSWYVYGDEVVLDRNEGVGTVRRATIYLHDVPVLYLPKFSFFIDDRRRSGWLMPTPRYSNASGLGLDLPYYFNLAPNYDFTAVLQVYSRRGLLFNGDFRYLTRTSVGDVWASWIPKDHAFSRFRNTLPEDTPVDIGKGSGSSRFALSARNRTVIDQHWHGDADFNYVTDHYFIRDFGLTPNNYGNRDQLLNQAIVYYNALNYQFSARAQFFQTMSSIYNTSLTEQYRRMPELRFSGDFPRKILGNNLALDSEFVLFQHAHHKQFPTGGRLAFAPRLYRYVELDSITLVPQLQLYGTFYELENNKSVEKSRSYEHIARVIPAFSADGRWHLQRSLTVGNRRYWQLLEPRIYYLYVPETHQDHLPTFDTYLPSVNYYQLFRNNRFVGADRVGDAHQVALGVSSELLDENGQEIISLSLGELFAFHKHKIEIDGYSFDPLLSDRLSPLVGSASYRINRYLKLNLDGAWSTKNGSFSNFNSGISYRLDDQKVFNFWYNFSKQSDQRRRFERVDLNRIGGSIGWQLNRNWHMLAACNYNVSYNRTDSYMLGVEYDSCCWAFRLMHTGELEGFAIDRRGSYTRGVFLQFMLKGLGSAGAGSFAGTGGDNRVNGYRTIFEASR